MSRQPNYFMIGLFIIGGTALILGAVVMLSSASLFKDTITVETYFSESVQGLAEGSPVKFRGVQIGQVERIMFTYNKYQPGVPLAERKPYVLVEFSVSPRGLGGAQGEPGTRLLEQLVENGLRATLGYQGLTGLAYVELDIVSNPEQYPALDVAWELPEYYIPSYPSTIAQVSESMQSVMTIAREIEDVPFSDIGRSVDELLTQLNNLESDEQIARAADRAIKLLEDSGQVVSHIRSMLEAEGVQQMPQNAADAVARARKLMELAGRDVPALLEDARRAGKLLGQAAARADKLLADRRIDAGLEDAAGAAADLREAAEELPETVEQVRTTLQDAAELVARQEDEVQALLRELQSISRNLNRLSEDLNRNPSRLLFGEPPPRWEDIEE